MAELTATFIDKSGELSTLTVKIANQTGATTMTEVIAFGTALETALENISLLTLKNIAFRQELLTEDTSAPSSEYANRENAMRVFMTGAALGKKYRISVPGPDLDNVARAALSDDFDPTDTEFAALISFLETYGYYDGGAVSVDKGVYVGRNN